MKKVLLLSTMALMITGLTFAEGNDKGKKKKAKAKTACCKKTKSCCSKM